MNSKLRFQLACEHGFVDRPPIDYLAHPLVDKRLKQHYQIETENELLEKLGSDFYYVSCRDISQNESCVPFYIGPALHFTDSERTCPFGIRFRRGAFANKFCVDETIAGPFEKSITAKAILNHPWPKANWFDFSSLIEEAQTHNDKIIVGGLWTGILGDSYRMYGFQNFLTDIILKPDVIKTLVSKMTEVYLELNDAIFSVLKGKIQIWFFGNDFGSQESLLFSPDIFRNVFMYPLSKLVDHAHSYGLKVMMHSCGAIVKIIPDLIEIGVDILDPVQVGAEEMEISELKFKFGQDIVFHGAIDTQKILPCSSAEVVEDHCINTIKIMGRNGGYIFAPSQLLGPDIPIENVIRMYDTIKNCNHFTSN